MLDGSSSIIRRYGAEIIKSILSKRRNYYFREIRESCRVKNILFLNLTSLPPISKLKKRTKTDYAKITENAFLHSSIRLDA